MNKQEAFQQYIAWQIKSQFFKTGGRILVPAEDKQKINSLITNSEKELCIKRAHEIYNRHKHRTWKNERNYNEDISKEINKVIERGIENSLITKIF